MNSFDLNHLMFAHLLIFTCIPAFLHVEHVGQDIVAAEFMEAGAEGQDSSCKSSRLLIKQKSRP